MGSHALHSRRVASRIKQAIRRRLGIRTSASIRAELRRMFALQVKSTTGDRRDRRKVAHS